MEKYLRKLQLIELEILKEIDRICLKNNIEYFVCNGTLIGAVRHQGFIPWDDDIDIAMTRKNYRKFLKVCAKDLGNEYFLDCYETNKRYCLPYAKIKRKNTLFVEKIDYNTYNEKNAIWIDIFPLDGCKKPNSKWHKRQFKIHSYIKTFITIKNGSNYYQNSKIKKNIYKTILTLVPRKFMFFLINKIDTFYDEDKVAYLTSLNTVYGIEKETFKKNMLFPTSKVMFEGLEFNGAGDYDYYLKKIYGDYMKLPPKEKQVNHHPYIIKFYDGEEIHFDSE